MPTRIVVTGASGFVGRHVAEAAVARGHDVIGLSRSSNIAASPPGVEWRRVDYSSVGALAAALTGADTIVHVAGRAHVLRGGGSSSSSAEFHDANVGVTSRIAMAAARAGARRVIFVSSVAAVASSSDVRLHGDEATQPDSAYGASKLAAERALSQVVRETDLNAAILRPPMIYGPGMRGNPLRLFGLVARGLPLPFGAIRNERSIVFVGNLASAIVQLAEADPMSLTSFVRDEEEPSTPRLVRSIANALHVPVRLWPFPPRVLRAAGALGDMLPDVIPFPLSHSAALGLTSSLLLDASTLARAIGFHPTVGLDDGLRVTGEWFRLRRA